MTIAQCGLDLRDRHDRHCGRAAGDITTKRWNQWRIIATPIGHAEYQGIRVTPNVYSTLEEIDLFGDAMEAIAAGRLH